MSTSIASRPFRSALALLSLALTATATADDTDIFVGAGSAADRPNILFALDNSANWSASIAAPNCYYDGTGGDGPKASSPGMEQGTKMGVAKCALYNALNAVPTGNVNVGLMLFNESPSSISGGYPRFAIREFTPEVKATLLQTIRDLKINDDKGNNAAFAKTLYEAYLYLSNGVPNVGTRGHKWDNGVRYGLPPGAVVSGRYATPSANTCGRNYIIFIANGSPGENTNDEARALLQGLGGNVTPITYPTAYVTNSDQANWADEFARFLSNKDVSGEPGVQATIVHTIAVLENPAQQDEIASDGERWRNFIRAIAQHGGGKYRGAANADEVAGFITDLINEIQAASSVFASASLPISVNSRGTYLNHVFMGMFLPDRESRPRWDGNLKQYQFAYDQVTDTLHLADSEGDAAINAGTGFIAPGAVSYWTHSSSFWVNAPSGTPQSASDRADGDIVAKGAAAQKLRDANMTDQSGRTIYTCVSCSNGTELWRSNSTQFATNNNAISAAALGVDAAARDTLIEWARGTDNASDERGPGGDVTVRPSVHGDVLHSRPAVVNFGGDIGVVVFYGANDGMLHAVVGNKTDSAYGEGGEMLWSFLPEEHFPKLRRLRDNDPIVRFAHTVSDTAQPRDYFVDGPVSVYQKFGSDGEVESVNLFVTMRRGGRVVYAFDVTNPRQPTFLWRKSSADYPVLGQTWSEARVARIKGHSRPVIIMGAGYDPTEDLLSPAAPIMGNAVLVLDTQSGALLHTFRTDRSVPADVSIVDSDADGYTDRAYAVDLGGNIYRIDFERTDPDTGITTDSESVWYMRKLADLGASGGKKFFYAPDVVITRSHAIVLAGSGDREKPLAANTQDYFYTILDRHAGKGLGASYPAGFHTILFSELAAQNAYEASANQYGCYTALEVGEKIVNAPITIAGRTYFGTNKPPPRSSNVCHALGIAKSYAAPLVCKQPIGTELVGGGLPPSPVAGIVEVPYTDPETGETGVKHVPFIIGGNPYAVDEDGDGLNDGNGACNKAIEGCKVSPIVPPRRSKIYWHTETER